MADDFMSGFLAGQGDGSNRGNSFLGGDGLAAIIIIALLFGWGRGGYGNGDNGGGSGAANGYVLATDFANIERKIDGVNNGLCDGFYAMNTGMLNGFANVTQAVTSGFYNSELSRCNQQAALMAQLNDMQRSADACCCENRAAIAQVRYDMATQACDTRNAISTAARDITDNQNAGTRAILDFLTQSRIQSLEADNQALRFAASQSAQNAYLVNALRPSPVPSYTVQNPYCCNNNGCNGCGY